MVRSIAVTLASVTGPAPASAGFPGIPLVAAPPPRQWPHAPVPEPVKGAESRDPLIATISLSYVNAGVPGIPHSAAPAP